MHLDDERIERLRDDELEPAERAEAESHIAGCAACRERLEHACATDARVSELLRALDTPLPAAAPRRVRSGRSATRIAAAAALLVVVAGAVAALPGSPVRAWLEGRIGGTNARRPAPPAPALGGVAVTPGERLVIELTPAGAGARALVRLVDGADVVVSAAPEVASFESGEGRLAVWVAGAGTVRIDVPSGAPEVEIRVRGRRAWRLSAGRVETAAPADSLGGFVLPLGD